MNVNDITTVLIKAKCCLDRLTKVTFILKAYPHRHRDSVCFNYCFMFWLFNFLMN